MKTAETKWGTFSYLEEDHIGRSMADGLHYEFALIDRIIEVCDLNGVAVDVGANIGTHTIPFGKKFKSVVAFEPHPIAHRLLKLNVTLNYLTNVEVYEVALGEAAGTGYMNIPEGPISNLGGARLTEQGNTEFPIHTLDSYSIPDLKLLKIDVEGYEERVIRGAEKTITKHRPIIVFERAENDFGIVNILAIDFSYHRYELVSKNCIMIP